MRPLPQLSYRARLDALRESVTGRTVTRNGTEETAVVTDVRSAPYNFTYQLSDGRRVPAEEWTVVK